MSKVITFSRVFPIAHSRQKEQTYFIEKIWKSLYVNGICPEYLNEYINNCFSKLNKDSFIGYNSVSPKLHTIRNGNRFKKGDFFSPRVWSGKPYNSKQIIIAPDLEIKNVFDIEIYETNEVFINGNFFCSFGSENWILLSKNDGLSSLDMKNWFNKLPFKGQIICWSDSVRY